ncbi:MAG: regulator of sigma protease [Chloroflexota bacterium]|jgi:regulator of sigma E protease|nr:regulator of sigma protease [Chloroflexota bacterium]
MNPLLVVVAVALVFGLLITFHEMGHLLVAKALGVKVLEFNVGFGPPLLQWGKGETRYGLRVIPLGGYVRLAGIDDGETGPRAFTSKPVWRRALIIVAGSVTNLVLPFFLLFGAGVLEIGGPLRVVSYSPGKPADVSGMPLNAEILSVDGQDLQSPYRMRQLINGSGGRTVTVRYRDPQTGAVDTKALSPYQVDGQWRIGISTRGGGFDLVGEASDAGTRYGQMVTGTLDGLASLASGRIPGGLTGPCGPSGPVGIVRATAEAASGGVATLLGIAAFISFNLGILNLMPLPALDGGRLVFILLEGVRRRPINPLYEQRVHYTGLIALLSLMVLISINDVARLGTPFADLISGCAG